MTVRRKRPGDNSPAGDGFTAAPRRHQRGLPRCFSIAEVAAAVHVSARTIRRWIDEGYMPVHRIGAVVRIGEDDLRAFLARYRES